MTLKHFICIKERVSHYFTDFNLLQYKYSVKRIGWKPTGGQRFMSTS